MIKEYSNDYMNGQAIGLSYPIEEISLAVINLGETQIRVAVSEETVERYFEVMVDEATRDLFPPIQLFRDPEERLWLADGHHRVMAAIRRGFKTIRAMIRPGTKADAIWEAAKANGRNGLQLGRQDIRQAVEMIVAAWPEKSNREIADAIGCSHTSVQRLRPSHSGGTNVPPEKRTGKDGKSYPARQPTKEPIPPSAPSVNKLVSIAPEDDSIDEAEIYELLAQKSGLSVETLKKGEYIIEHADEKTKEKLRRKGDEEDINEVYDRLMAENASTESVSLPVDKPQTSLQNIYPHYDEEALAKDLIDAFSASCVKSLPFALVDELCRDEQQKMSIEIMVGHFVNRCILKMSEPQYKLFLDDLFKRTYGDSGLADKIMKLVKEEGKNHAK